MIETITEQFSMSGGRVDEANGQIAGVKILGPKSSNGRRYSPEAIRSAVPKYEGAKVNVDHSSSPHGGRAYADRLGSLKNIRAEAGGLFGDLHFNPKHALAEQLVWDAKHAPGNVGMSHVIEGRTARRNGELVVEEITKVFSVDLVADPATTAGLFEAAISEGVARNFVEELCAIPRKMTEAESRDFFFQLTDTYPTRRKAAQQQASKAMSTRDFAEQICR